MTSIEFSSQFDILFNNLNSGGAPGLTEYEKGVILTKAQLEIVKNYHTALPGGNKYQKGIGNSEKRFIDFSSIIGAVILNAENSDSLLTTDERGKLFNLVDDSDNVLDILFILGESFKTGNSESSMSSYQVLPLKSEEYERLMSKPSGEPLRNQVWRLAGKSSNNAGVIEIVPHYKDKDNSINRLYLNYIRKPYPIILEDLRGTINSIDGKQVPLYYTKTSDRYEINGVINKEGFEYGFTLTVSPSQSPIIIGPSQSITPDNIIKVNFIQYNEASNTLNVGLSFRDSMTSSTVTFSNPILESRGLVLSDFNTSELLGEPLYTYSTKDVPQDVCELPEELHDEILQRAVEIAKSLYPSDSQSLLTVGSRSE